MKTSEAAASQVACTRFHATRRALIQTSTCRSPKLCLFITTQLRTGKANVACTNSYTVDNMVFYASKPYAEQLEERVDAGHEHQSIKINAGPGSIGDMWRRYAEAPSLCQVNLRHLRDYRYCLPPEEVYQFARPHRTAQRSPLTRPLRAVPRFARGSGGRVECLSRIVGDRIVRHLDRHARCPLGKPVCQAARGPT